jgi:hypothetical protein
VTNALIEARENANFERVLDVKLMRQILKSNSQDVKTFIRRHDKLTKGGSRISPRRGNVDFNPTLAYSSKSVNFS